MSKTHIDKLRDPKFLGGWDLQDENGKTVDMVVTIKEVKSELTFNQKSQSEESVITVYFEECKPIILNSENRKTLKKVTDTGFIEEIAGKKIQLTTKRIKAFGEWWDAIRIVKKAPTKDSAKDVDIEKCLTSLRSSKDLDELASKWIALSDKEKKTPEVLAEKEKLKSTLK